MAIKNMISAGRRGDPINQRLRVLFPSSHLPKNPCLSGDKRDANIQKDQRCLLLENDIKDQRCIFLENG